MLEDHLDREQIENIEKEIFAENKIQAIKICREYTGWGLKESKNYVEKHINDLIEKDSEKYGHLLKQGRSGCFATIKIFICSAAGIIWMVFS